MSVGGIGIGLAAAIALVLAPVCSGAGKSKSPQIGMAKIKAGMQTPVGSENKVGPHHRLIPEGLGSRDSRLWKELRVDGLGSRFRVINA